MGIGDEAQEFAQPRDAQTDRAVERAGDAADARTGGRFAGGAASAQQKADAAVGGDDSV